MVKTYTAVRIAELANTTLTRNTALVLVGEQGCGKTTMAAIISAMNGEGVPAHITGMPKFSEIVGLKCGVVIIENVQFSRMRLELIKPLLSMGDMPLLIITTNVAPELDPDDRRFNVVHL